MSDLIREYADDDIEQISRNDGGGLEQPFRTDTQVTRERRPRAVGKCQSGKTICITLQVF
jgi:hypothetical protein